ncbi:MAG: hypothetical protein JWN72_119 [Thermoleophilia bacterium]|nr:hypothetical protein [Thermoleophilia bacterium]
MRADTVLVHPDRQHLRPLVALPLVLTAWAWGAYAFHWLWLTGLAAFSVAYIVLERRARRAPKDARFASAGRFTDLVHQLSVMALVGGWLILGFAATQIAPQVRRSEPCHAAEGARGDCHAVRGTRECGDEPQLALLLLADFARPSIYRHCTWGLAY